MLHKVLVVDDDAPTRTALGQLLRLSGYEADTAASGAEALSVVDKSAPDLVVLDDRMPGQSGLATLAALRGDPKLKEIPVIFYSSDASRRRQEVARNLGACAWLVKGPDTWDRLLHQIQLCVSN